MNVWEVAPRIKFNNENFQWKAERFQKLNSHKILRNGAAMILPIPIENPGSNEKTHCICETSET